jgi:excisionase family DNA binding protein
LSIDNQYKYIKMAKKLSFDKLPEAVEKILNILTSEESEHTALPELLQRVALLEKKIDYLQRSVSPDKPVMDMHEVCRVLKLRPKAVSELAMSGTLPSREQGKRTVFYEEGVVRYFMTLGPWKETTATKPAPVKPALMESASLEIAPDKSVSTGGSASTAEGRRRIDINVAGEIVNRSAAAIYQLIKTGNIPYYKDGRKVYFFTDELREWVKDHPARKRRAK